MTTRRKFLGHSLTAVAASLIAGAIPAWAEARPDVRFPANVRERIAVASYPFRDFIVDPEHPGGSKIELKDFAAHVISKFKVNKIELWTGHFPSTDASYVREMRKALDEVGAAVVDIAVDGEHCPYSNDASERDKAVAFSNQWVDIAAMLGSPSIRTNLPDDKNVKPDLERTVESLRRVVEYAAGKKVVVHLENDNPVSEDPFYLVKVIEKLNSPWLHALPDFANSLSSFDEQHAYTGVDAMFGHAYGICHVKETEVSPNGKAVHVDMAKTFAMLKKHEFKGYCSMEFDSPGDPYAGTAALIEQTIHYLS
jgi:sugar phosphate isomerase/epimerase